MNLTSLTFYTDIKFSLIIILLMEDNNYYTSIILLRITSLRQQNCSSNFFGIIYFLKTQFRYLVLYLKKIIIETIINSYCAF